jgi:hypothetical protein
MGVVQFIYVLCAFLFTTMLATYPANLNLPDLVVVIIFS